MPSEAIETNSSSRCYVQLIDKEFVLLSPRNGPCDVFPSVVPMIFPIIYIVPSYLLFPIFLFVQRQNQESDASTSVYPIVKHFNYVVKKMMVLLTISILLLCFLFYFDHFYGMRISSGEWTAFSVTMTIFVLIYLFTVLSMFLLISFIPNIQYVLHFLLGLQRLLIYFFPEKEKYIHWSEKRLNILLAVLYAIFFVLDLRTAYYVISHANFGPVRNSDLDKDIQVNIIIFLFLNFLQVLGALFYIPIMISVSKLTHLTSAAVNRPQKYIFYQILIHLISRIWMFFIVLYDIVLTPLVIQLAYLFCNQKNVQTLLSSPWKVIIKSLIVQNYRQPQVQPSTLIESTKI